MKTKQLIAQYAPQEPPPSSFRHDALHGQVIIITGAGHGVGESTAHRAAELGATVVLFDIEPDRLEVVRQDLERRGATCLTFSGDLAKPAFVKRAFAKIKTKLGRVDGVVHCAYRSIRGRIEDMDIDAAREVWNVNVGAALHVTQAALPMMKPRGGSVVFVGSILAWFGRLAETAYISSKCALEGVTRVLANELAPDLIRVNLLLPGAIQTGWQLISALSELPETASERQKRKRADEHLASCRKFQPLPVMGRPDMAADAILFLLSDASRYITGICLPVDGGYAVDGRRKIVAANPAFPLRNRAKQPPKRTGKGRS